MNGYTLPLLLSFFCFRRGRSFYSFSYYSRTYFTEFNTYIVIMYYLPYSLASVTLPSSLSFPPIISLWTRWALAFLHLSRPSSFHPSFLAILKKSCHLHIIIILQSSDECNLCIRYWRRRFFCDKSYSQRYCWNLMRKRDYLYTKGKLVVIPFEWRII